MKKMMVLVGFVAFMATQSFAGEINKMPMLDFSPTEGMDYIYEIKTTKFDKVVLDCQSFITGISFSDQEEVKSSIYLDMFMCEDLVQYLSESKKENLPVCIGLDIEFNELYITRETKECY